MDDTFLKKTRGGKLEFPSYCLAELDRLCRTLEITRSAATRLCKSLEIPLIYIGNRSYFNEFAFERAMFILSRTGGPGYAAPGSHHKLTGRKGVATSLDDNLRAQLDDPTLLVEMVAAQGRNTQSAARVAELMKKIESKKEIAKTLSDDNGPLQQTTE